MVDFEKIAINAFEDQFLAVLTGYFFHSSQNVYKIIQLALLGTRRKNSLF